MKYTYEMVGDDGAHRFVAERQGEHIRISIATSRGSAQIWLPLSEWQQVEQSLKEDQS